MIGAKGSALDLVMNTLYFGSQPPEEIDLSAAEQVDESGLALAIPIYSRFEARRHPVVGPPNLRKNPPPRLPSQPDRRHSAFLL